MERMEIIRNTAEEVLAPVMVEYVKWILSRAQQLGIQRIYFLARDGWPMYRSACILSENRHPHIECRYLECSRYALRLPSFAIRKKESLDQIFLDGIDVTLRKILARAAISGQEAVRAAQAAGASCDLDVILSRREIQRLKPLFFHCPLFWQLVEYHAAKALPAACGYLRQEGLFEDVRWAVADSGWTGSLQETLETLLRAEGYQREFCGFYFGLYQLPRDAKESGYHAYYFDVRGKIRRKARFSNSLFECVFSAPQGMTEGYRKNRQGQYVPLRRPALEENFPALRAVEQAVETRARQAAVRLPFPSGPGSCGLRGGSSAFWNLLWGIPRLYRPGPSAAGNSLMMCWRIPGRRSRRCLGEESFGRLIFRESCCRRPDWPGVPQRKAPGSKAALSAAEEMSGIICSGSVCTNMPSA